VALLLFLSKWVLLILIDAAAAGLKWKHNASRHSFGSYRMAEIKNAFHVAEEMGNSPAMVKKHYFQAVTKAEASRFWSICPG
jgi:hypothetical protein